MKRNKLIKQCVTLGILSLLAIVVSIICVVSSVGSYWAGDTGLGMMIVAIVLGVLTLVAFGIFDYVLIDDYVKEYKDGAKENDSGDIQSLNQFCNQMRIEEDSIEAVKKLDEAIATAENVTEAIDGEEKVIDTTAMIEEAVEAMSDVANAASVTSGELTATAEAMAGVVAGDTTLVESESKDTIEVKSTEEAPAKKKRGRPRKKPIDEVKE